MAITINGSGPVAGVTTLGMTSGTITGLSAGGLPDATVTQPDLAAGVAGTGPAFSAYKATTNQSITTGTFTKVTFNTEEWDTANCFDSTTNYRFTPNVAGYYQVNSSLDVGGTASSITRATAYIYKNGVAARLLAGPWGVPGSTEWQIGGSAVVYLNGSTDYIEMYVYVAGSSINVYSGGTEGSYFQASLVRAA